MLIDPGEEKEVRQYGCRDVRMTWSVSLVVVQAGLISEGQLSRNRLGATKVCCRVTDVLHI